jgi:RimJ/RimL family protein N-acetyltransferase
MLLDAMWNEVADRLEGRLVTLERLGRHHADALRTAGADPLVWRWMIVDNVDEWLESSFDEPGRIAYATLVRGVPSGSTSFLGLAPEHRRLEIGATWLAPSAWRTGANAEAKLLMLRHAFEDLGCLRVEFKTDALNEQTRRALEALPSRFEGVHRKHMLVRGGERRDSAWYSILDDEWPQVRANLERRLIGRAVA